MADGAHQGQFSQADLRLVPMENYLDLASCQMDPKRKLAFVTALNLDKHLLFGYVFPSADYPWLMSWMNYTGDARRARHGIFHSAIRYFASGDGGDEPALRYADVPLAAGESQVEDPLSDVLCEGA